MKMFCSVKLKTVLVCFLSALCALSAFCIIVSAKGKENAKTASERSAFLKDLGISVQAKSERQKQVQIPLEFSDVFMNYNDLQKTAGYDLADYKGVKAVMYSYPAINVPGYTVNLLVYSGRVIGGDLSSAELSGKMVALDKKEIEKCLN